MADIQSQNNLHSEQQAPMPAETRAEIRRASRANTARRMGSHHFMTFLAVGGTVLVLVPLVAILVYLVYKGASSLNVAFFTQTPKPVGEQGGGMANSIVGSAIVLSLASLLGIPVGIAGGVYLAEY